MFELIIAGIAIFGSVYLAVLFGLFQTA